MVRGIHEKIIVRMVARPAGPATGLSGLDAGIGEWSKSTMPRKVSA